MNGKWSKKALAMMLSSSMMAGMFSVNSFAVTGDQVAKDMTYRGTGNVINTSQQNWNGYGMDLELAVKNGKIEKIHCMPASNMEPTNKMFVDIAEKTLADLKGKPATIKTINEFKTDTLTGATCTLNASKDIASKLLSNAEAAHNDTPAEPDNPNSGEGNNSNPGENNQDPKLEGIKDDAYIYGKLNLPYADFYFGELNILTDKKQDMDLEIKDKAASIRGEGMYDAVTSATKKKSKMFKTTYYEEKANGVDIKGIKDVNIAISKGLYTKAQAAIKDDKTCNNSLLKFVKELKLNKKPTEAPNEYKVLNGDGTFTATNSESDYDLYARTSVSTESAWGHYLINVTSKKMPKIDEIDGIVVKDRNGKYYGMEHLENIWLKPEEFSFAVRPGFTEPHGNKVDYLRHKELEENTITEIRYLVRNKADLVVTFPSKCKKLLEKNFGAKADNAEFKDGVKVTPVLTTPEGSSYELKSISKGRTKLEKDKDYTVDGKTIIFKETANTGIGEYRATYVDKRYADMSAVFLLTSKYKDGDVKLADNQLILPKDLKLDDYAKTVRTVKLDGKRIKGRDLMNIIFKKNGSVDFDAQLIGRGDSKSSIFKKGPAGIYTIEIESKGYPNLKGRIIAPSSNDIKVTIIDDEHAIKTRFLGHKIEGYDLNDYDYEAYDISLRNASDEIVQPAQGKKVKVKVNLRTIKPEDLIIFHDAGNKKLTEIKDFKIDGNSVEFETAHFSQFVFANKKPASANPNAGNNSATPGQNTNETKVKTTKVIKKVVPLNGIVKTGDASPISSYALTLLLAISALVAAVLLRRKRNS